MRARSLVLALALSLCGLAATPSSQAASGPTPARLTRIEPGGFMSPNISYVATLPFESPAVSAEVVQLGAQKRLYVSTTKEISVFDVTNPALPLLLGTFQFHNWENEDVAVSADGRTVLMTDFFGVLYTIVLEVNTLPGGLVSILPKGQIIGTGNHTIECVDDACDWAYGSEGDIFDLRNKAQPKRVGSWGGSGHDVERDSSGLVWTDTTPILALDVSDPARPVELARSDSVSMSQKRTAYQHNNLRPFADEYRPRLTDEEKADPNLRPGEILLGQGETNFTGTCDSGSGPFATYDMRKLNLTQPNGTTNRFKVADVFRPINGNYDGGNGNAAVNAMGCSGHWFDVSPLSTHDQIITANGWYDHGTRIFGVNGKTAKISQLGYFQPVVGSASASYWIDDEYIYTIDYYRGIDILRYDDAPVPTKAEFRASWLAKVDNFDPVSDFAQYYCRQAVLKVA